MTLTTKIYCSRQYLPHIPDTDLGQHFLDISLKKYVNQSLVIYYLFTIYFNHSLEQASLFIF
jgi:hypothetical protein